MALNPLLPAILGLGLAGWAAGLAIDRVRRRRGAPAAGAAFAALALAGAALLAPALSIPDGVPSPARLLVLHAPWHGVEESDPSPGNPVLADVVWQIEPWLLHLRRELRAGRLPFWNPHQYAGAPFWSNGQSAPLFPLHLLFAALPLSAGLVLLPWLKVLIAGFGARGLARELGLSAPAALLAGLIYPLSGMLAGFVLYPMGNALALVPWVLWAVERLAAGRSGVLPLAAAAGLQLLAGHPETALHTALLSALYLAVRGASPGGWLRWAGGWTLGAGLAAVQLVPLAIELAASARWQAGGVGFAEPLGRLLAQPLRLVLPGLYGDPADGTWWGPYNYLATAVYAGALALPLAGAGLGAVRAGHAAGESGRVWDRRWLAVAALLVFSVAAAYHLPPVRQALAAVPVVGRAAHHRLIFGVELALALLAAAGWERWRAGRGGRGLAAGACAAALLLAAAWALHAGEWSARGLAVSQGLWTVWAGAAALLLLAGRRLPPRPRRALAAALPALAALELVAAHGGINPGVSLGELFPETPAVRFLAERPGRIAAAGTVLRPNAAMVYGLADVRGDDTVKSARRLAFERAELGVGHPNYFTPIRRWDPSWIDPLAVRWVMAPPGEPPPAGLAGAGFRLVHDGLDARVWGRAAPPTAWWRGAVAAAAPAPAPAAGLPPPAAAGRRVEVTASEPGRLALRWATPVRDLLVVSESWDAGWSARAAGGRAGDARLPVRPVDGVLLGVELGPGEGVLELVYRPAGIGWGAAASAAALAAVLGLAALGRRRTRPPAAAEEPS